MKMRAACGDSWTRPKPLSQVRSEALRDFVEKPLMFLKKVIVELDKPSKAALALIFVSGGNVTSPIGSSKELDLATELLGATTSETREAMKALNGSLVKRIRFGGADYWTYKHPTVGDAFADIVADDPELLHIYVGGAKPERLVEEVVCGEVTIQGARVVVPRTLFKQVAKAIHVLEQKELLQFLSSRRDKEFLSQYLELHPDFQSGLSTFSNFRIAFCPEIEMAARLREFGLLNQTSKLAIFKTLEDVAVERPDTDFLNPNYVGHLLRESEANEILQNVRNRIVPVAQDRVRRQQRDYDMSEPPDDYFGPIIEVLETLQDRFGEDADVRELLDQAVADAYGALDDAKQSYQDEDSSSDDHREFHENDERRYSAVYEADRSIFDDVDQ